MSHERARNGKLMFIPLNFFILKKNTRHQKKYLLNYDSYAILTSDNKVKEMIGNLILRNKVSKFKMKIKF